MAFARGRTGKTFPFGRPDKARVSRALGAPIIAELPLDPEVSSKGLPRVIASDGEISRDLLRLSSVILKGREQRAGILKGENHPRR